MSHDNICRSLSLLSTALTCIEATRQASSVKGRVGYVASGRGWGRWGGVVSEGRQQQRRDGGGVVRERDSSSNLSCTVFCTNMQWLCSVAEWAYPTPLLTPVATSTSRTDFEETVIWTFCNLWLRLLAFWEGESQTL